MAMFISWVSDSMSLHPRDLPPLTTSLPHTSALASPSSSLCSICWSVFPTLPQFFPTLANSSSTSADSSTSYPSTSIHACNASLLLSYSLEAIFCCILVSQVTFWELSWQNLFPLEPCKFYMDPQNMLLRKSIKKCFSCTKIYGPPIYNTATDCQISAKT